MTRLIVAICIALAASLCLAAVSSAHKVNIFAYVDGDSIVTDSGYSRTRRVNKGVVEVHDAASGKLLLSGTTDEEGKYAFAVPAEAREGKMDLLLVLKAGEGHQAEWTGMYDEFGAGSGADPEAPAASEPVAAPAAPATATPSAPADTAAIKAVVHAELAPLKQMLAEMHDSGPGVTEILGGIGYIFGLFGVAAYMKSRAA